MSFQEKSSWILLAIVVVVFTWYFAAVLGDLATQEAGDISYRGEVAVAVVALIVLAAVSHGLAAFAAPSEFDQADERDKEINRFGEYIGGYVLGTGALVVLGMAVYEVEHFWIANALLMVLVLSEIVSESTKLVLYRRGM